MMGSGLVEKRGLANHKPRLPIIGWDYFYITSGGLKTTKELDAAEATIDPEARRVSREVARKAGTMTTCIIGRDYSSKTTFAHTVPCKGLDEDG